MEKSILKLLRNHGDRAFRAKEIARRLDIREREDFLMCRDLLEDLADAGRVERIKGNRFGFRPPANLREGVLSVHPDGFGFVTDSRGEEYFIKSKRMGTALDRDRVEIGISGQRPRDGRKHEAEIVRVLERTRNTAVGSFRRHGHFGVVEVDDKRMTRDIYVAKDDWGGAQDGDKVLVTIDRFDNPKSSPEGRIVNVIGSQEDPATRVLALAMSVGVDADFPEEALREARDKRAQIIEEDLEGREDFRGDWVFTIDPVDARDFDDALHIKDLGDGQVEVGVHIADVGHFVPVGSALDKAAYDRGTSTYLVDRVIPMLPERLSGDLCSLRPNEQRLSYSCVFRLDGKAGVHDYRITPSVIHSKARLTYEEAQEVIDGGKPDAVPEPVQEGIRRLWDLAQHLIDSRFSKGSIDFDLPEVRVLLDEEGHVKDIVRKDRIAANRLIEEFMLLANKTVAQHAVRARPKREFVYRTHDHPDKEKIQQLVEYVRGFGYQVQSTEGTIEPSELNRLIHAAAGKPEQPVIQEAALRAMSKARYSPDDSGHFGLGFRHYTHFTSPIRRYPDLIVHRELRRLAAGHPGPEYGPLKAQCDHLSERERVADEAQRESVKLKQVEYMQQHVGDRFTGVISGVTKFGLFVELDSILVEGLVHVRDLSDDYYEYDERRFTLMGRSSGRKFKLGDPVTVTVAAANTETREIDFQLV